MAQQTVSIQKIGVTLRCICNNSKTAQIALGHDADGNEVIVQLPADAVAQFVHQLGTLALDVSTLVKQQPIHAVAA